MKKELYVNFALADSANFPAKTMQGNYSKNQGPRYTHRSGLVNGVEATNLLALLPKATQKDLKDNITKGTCSYE